MNLETLISSNAVIDCPDIKSRKRALEMLANTLASQLAEETEKSVPPARPPGRRTDKDNDDDIDAESASKACTLEIFQLLTDREKLGSTSIGHGIALPHARSSLTNTTLGALLKLDKGIDFDSPDHQATDLIFALLVPEHSTDEHLKVLSHLATLFSDEEFCKTLRQSDSKQKLYDRLINWQLTSQAS